MSATEGSEQRVLQYHLFLKKLRNEFVFEIAFVVTCLALVIGLQLKIVLAVVLTCLKFAIPDFVAAYLVLKHDPSRLHGIGVAFLFLATGMARASQFAFIALFASACILAPAIAGQVGRQFAALGLFTGFVCAFSFLASVFPLSLIAVIIAKKWSIKLSFASQLTKLRKANANARSKWKEVFLDVGRSVTVISMASAAGLTVCLISLLFLLPPKGFFNNIAVLVTMLSAFVLPLALIPFMAISLKPVGNRL